MGIATAILKLGIISVAIVGANMFIAGEINIIVYIAFLMLTVSIYLPIEGIITFMADASFIRCASPPESSVDGCPNFIYPSPTASSVSS